jgi:RNA polymerase sigma-70 factor (ECF subfamily)
MAGQGANSGNGPHCAASGPTSTTLLDRVKAKHEDAWQTLVDLYGPQVYRWGRRLGLQGEDAADVVQEVFSAVATSIANFRRDRPGDSFRGWLWGITRIKAADHFRRLRDKPRAKGGTDAHQRLAQIPDQSLLDSKTDKDPEGERGVKRRAVELIRASVEDRTWKAFWRVAVDGQPLADVADELGMSVGAVYQAKYRVRRRIRSELGDLID